MEGNIQENVVIRDWLTFTTKEHSPRALIALMGLDNLEWTEQKGGYGYKDRLRFGYISVYYNGREDMGVCVEMSGQGCREFEEYSMLAGKWDDLFSFIKRENLHITRLDVAYDDHTGVLDIDRVLKDIETQHYVSRSVFWDTTRSNRGSSCIIGSPQSRVRIRIYDKAAERGMTDCHWIRVELQMRDARAEAFSDIELPLGEAFSGVLLNYLRILQPSDGDSNKSRWETADYWINLLGDVGRISIYTAPGTEYNYDHTMDYVVNHWGNAIDCVMQGCGDVSTFVDLIRNRICKPNPKYEIILKERRAQQEVWANKVRECLEINDLLEEIEPGVYRRRDYDAAYEEWQRTIFEDKPVDVWWEWLNDVLPGFET